MPGNNMIGEQPEAIDIIACQKILKRSNANVTGSNAGEDAAREPPLLAQDSFASGNRSHRSRCGNSERGHGFAHNVLAEYRAEGGFAIAAARERCAPGALQLHIVTFAIGGDDFTKKKSAAVAELGHESTELVAGIGLRNRLGTLWNRIAREHGDSISRLQPVDVHRELGRESAVETDELRLRNMGGFLPGEEPLRQSSIGVVEGNVHW